MGQTESAFKELPVSIKTHHGHFLTAGNGRAARRGAVQTDRPASRPAEAWEKFTPVVAGKGRLAFRTCHGTYLTALRDNGREGGIQAYVAKPQDRTLWEYFVILPQPDGTIALRTHHNTYVTAEPPGNNRPLAMAVDRREIGDWERFEVAAASLGIRTCLGTMLSAQGGHVSPEGDTHSSAEVIGPWEEFVIEPRGSGRFALRTAHGTYLKAEHGAAAGRGQLQSNRRKLGPWEMFHLVFTGPQTVALLTYEGKYVSAIRDVGGPEVGVTARERSPESSRHEFQFITKSAS